MAKIKQELDRETSTEIQLGGTDHCKMKPVKINPKQLAIVVAAAHAGEDGLTLEEIQRIWGWDGSNTDKLKFERDFEALNATEGGEIGFLRGPFVGGPERWMYDLNTRGRDYLIDNNLI